MNKCIFCETTTGSFTTREHILPQSLGGGDWAILPDGLFCDGCQNRFGSEIEQQALKDYPFSNLRVFLGIPTKKRKPPWSKNCEGTLYGTPWPAVVEYDPAPNLKKPVLEGTKTQIRILAHPLKPDMICRFLIKMGIEVVANDDPAAAFDQKLDSARQYALTGEKAERWWYLQRERPDEVSAYITKGVSAHTWHENVKLEVVKLEENHEVFHLKLLYLDMLVPLTMEIYPDIADLKEPEYRLFWT